MEWYLQATHMTPLLDVSDGVETNTNVVSHVRGVPHFARCHYNF
jgi:hypothetical protein